MFIQHLRKQVFAIMIVLMLMAISIIWADFVSADDTKDIAISSIFIDSRFKLWDSSEKILDGKFNITIFYFNKSVNNTAYYKIDLDNNISEGFFTDFIINQYSINESMIHYIKIYINNKTVYYVNNIIITNGVTKSTIDYANNVWTINLNPSEWSKKERSIFYAVVLASLLSVLIAYRITSKNRKNRGITTYK